MKAKKRSTSLSQKAYVPTRPACEPRSDVGMLVSGVVVNDEMDVELSRYIGFDVPQVDRNCTLESLHSSLASHRNGEDSIFLGCTDWFPFLNLICMQSFKWKNRGRLKSPRLYALGFVLA
jgi:hypothetical protein